MRSTDTARELYSPDPVPSDTKLWPTYLSRELNKLAGIVNADLKLETLHAEPSKPRDGMIRKADGTTWNPGSGEGVYCYYAGSWNFLG